MLTGWNLLQVLVVLVVFVKECCYWCCRLRLKKDSERSYFYLRFFGRLGIFKTKFFFQGFNKLTEWEEACNKNKKKMFWDALQKSNDGCCVVCSWLFYKICNWYLAFGLFFNGNGLTSQNFIFCAWWKFPAECFKIFNICRYDNPKSFLVFWAILTFRKSPSWSCLES